MAVKKAVFILFWYQKVALKKSVSQKLFVKQLFSKLPFDTKKEYKASFFSSRSSVLCYQEF